MKKLTILWLAIMMAVTANLSAQSKSNLEEEFIETVEAARDRVMTIFENGKLSQVQYEGEREVVREAEKYKKLIESGQEVSDSILKEWTEKLQRLGVPQNREGEGVQYREKKGEGDKITILITRLDTHMEKLDMQYQKKDISKTEYQKRRKAID
ncbi:hypothetical protein E1176_00525, partial [Fulvivirga sp. RKSG066]|uniref:hypothetical protein n=1 Tax=Fulvivirga aurantia TaxID=2529383 RepID=UPI0012BBF250